MTPPRTGPSLSRALPAGLLALLWSMPVVAQTEPPGMTLAADSASPRAEASMEDVGWLAGRWSGEGLGTTVEEVWLPAAGGAMVGVFRMVRDGEVELYELVTLEEEEGSLVLKLKHFGRDLVGWEEKEEAVAFPLVRRDPDTLWFDGLTIRRLTEDHMRVWVALGPPGAVRDELFEYRRVGPAAEAPQG